MKKWGFIYLVHLMVIFAFATLCFYIVQNASHVWKVSSIEITVPPTGNIELGNALLGQKRGYRSAEDRHIVFCQGKQGIEIANVASYKKIDAKTDRFDTLFIQRFPLHVGDKVLINEVMIEVASISNTCLTLRNTSTNDSIEWNNDHLVYKGKDYENRSWKALSVHWLRRNIPWINAVYAKKTSETSLFTLGGSTELYHQWAIEGLQPKSAAITWLDGTFYLAPAKEHRILFLPHGETTFKSFNDAWIPLQGEMGTVERLIIGSTYYKVHQEGNTVSLYPVSRQDVFVEKPLYTGNEAVHVTYTEESWVGAGKDLRAWLTTDVDTMKLLVVAGIGFGVALFLWMFFHRYMRASCLSLPALALLTSLCCVAYFFGGVLDFKYLVLLCFIVFTWSTCMLWGNGKSDGTTMCLWLCCIIFCSIGLVVLLQLQAGSENTRWEMYVQKHLWASIGLAFMVALASYISLADCTALRCYLGRDRSSGWVSRGGMFFTLIIVIVFMLFYGVFGNEVGLAGFQPSEFLKFLFVVVGAVAAVSLRTLRENSYVRYYDSRGLFYFSLYLICFGVIAVLASLYSLTIVCNVALGFILTPFILFLLRYSFYMFLCVLIAFLMSMGSLTAVRDMSPVFILVTFAVYWIWSVSSPSVASESYGGFREYWSQSPLRMWTRTLVLLFLACSIVLFALVYINPQYFKGFLPQADRFAVWSNPLAYPHSGAQVLGSLKMVFAGGWTGAGESCFGSNGMASALPAVQDDFILAFLLYKFGALSSILLLCFQIFYIGLLWTIGNQARGVQTSYDERDSSYMLSYVLHGLAVIHALQWAISWGNTLGLLPVMGQPMTWISAGNSHFIAIACTSFLLALFTTWSLPDEEE